MWRPGLPSLLPPVLVSCSLCLLPHPVSSHQGWMVQQHFSTPSTVNVALLLNLREMCGLKNGMLNFNVCAASAKIRYRFPGLKNSKERIGISHADVEPLHIFASREPWADPERHAMQQVIIIIWKSIHLSCSKASSDVRRISSAKNQPVLN